MNNMSDFHISFTVLNQEYYDSIEKSLKAIQKESCKITIISEKAINTEFDNFVLNEFFINYPDEVKDLNPKIWKNKKLFQADPRYINKDKKINQALQQNYINACRKYFSINKVDVMFSGAAGYLIWTIPHTVALEFGVLSYKLLQTEYLNPYLKGKRIWFSTNLFWDLKVNESSNFNYDNQKIKEHISDLKHSMLVDDFNWAKKALELRKNYSPNSIYLVIKRFLKIIFKNDYLSKFAISSFVNTYLNLRHYIKNTEIDFNYILYPLNQPNDEQLLVRAPNFQNNITNIKMLADCIPKNIKLIVKEHPVNPGMIKSKDIKLLKNTFSNLYFVDPNIPIRPLIKKSSGIFTINSTSGIEALICGKKIIVMGNSYYKYNNMAIKPKSKENLKQAIEELLSDFKIDHNSTEEMLKTLLNQTYPEPCIYEIKNSETFLEDALISKINILKNSK